MGIIVEFNPDLALRHIDEWHAGRRVIEECLPERLEAGTIHPFLKKDQRNYWLMGELPLLETKGDAQLSKPLASIVILEATHFLYDGVPCTKGKYKIIEVFHDDAVRFNGFAKINRLRIGVIGSMQYTEQMVNLKEQLNLLGHGAFLTDLHAPFVGKSDAEKEVIKIDQKMNQDAMREFWRAMQDADAVLVANYDKHGVSNYIGGNTFLEMGFAHVLEQKIYLLNPIPDMPYYKTEIEAMRPIVLNGDLSLIGFSFN